MQETDFIVIGSGIAGLRAAIELAQVGRVTVLTKDKLTESNTEYAQGGVAVVLGDDDRMELHLEDTIQAGAGLCDVDAARVLVEDGPRAVMELIEWGCQFDRVGERWELGREAAHSRRRVLHAHGDSTGREMVRTLLGRLKDHPGVRMQERAQALGLIIEDGRCVGVRYVDASSGVIRSTCACAVILASGGAGHLYLHTTNPDVSTGDGMAMAYLAGATLCDMEFVQFHPTALALTGAPRFLLTEAMRGEGGFLRNALGERFMARYHEKAELAPRDVVARSIVLEMKRTGKDCVYLDVTHLDPGFVRRRFPRIYNTCLRFGIDITKDLIPVSPAAHYFMGGVRTDIDGWTGIEGLYAAGEVSCTGAHGANRLASNSLLEGLVFGARAARKAIEKSRRISGKIRSEPEERATDWRIDPYIYDRVRQTMWDKVGIVRDASGLSDAIAIFRDLEKSQMNQSSRNFLTAATLVARAALFRQESRGAHFRTDFPSRDDRSWLCHSAQQLDKGAFTIPVRRD